MIEWSKQKTMMIDSVKMITPGKSHRSHSGSWYIMIIHKILAILSGWWYTHPIFHVNNSGYNTNNSGYNTNNSCYIWLYVGIYICIWLVVSTQPLWKIMDFVSWDDEIPWKSQLTWKVIQNSMVPVTTNQPCTSGTATLIPGFCQISWSITIPNWSYTVIPSARKKRRDVSPQFLEI